MAKATYNVSLKITITNPPNELPEDSQVINDILAWLADDADTVVSGGYYEGWEVESIEVV